MISHHRIHDHQGIFLRKVADKPLHDINLPHRTQIAGGNALEFEADLIPVLNIRFHPVCIIIHKEIRKRRIIGKNRGRQRTSLHPHIGKNRKYHRHGTPSVSCNIVDHCNFFLHLLPTSTVLILHTKWR